MRYEVSIIDKNLRPFLVALAWIVDYEFDDLDWTAISHGFGTTDAADELWYEYAFYGESSATFKIAEDLRDGVMTFHLEVEQRFLPQIRIVARMLRRFQINHDAWATG